MFGRATMTLGIGPHSSLFCFRVTDTTIVSVITHIMRNETLVVVVNFYRHSCTMRSYFVVCLYEPFIWIDGW